MLKFSYQQRGLSLIEVLIGLTLSIAVAAAILMIFTNSWNASQQIIVHGKLDRDLYAMTEMIASDVQRAGYWHNATSSNVNPFMASGVDITANGNCLMLSYDSNANNTVEDNEKLGYLLQNNAIQFRPAGASFPTNCNPAPTDWENLTDPAAVTITAFTATLQSTPVTLNAPYAATHTTMYRRVVITVTGHLTGDNTTSKTITQTIPVYNNHYS